MVIDPVTRKPLADPDQAWAHLQAHLAECVDCTSEGECRMGALLLATWDKADRLLAEAHGQEPELYRFPRETE